MYVRNQRPKASQESPAARTWRIRAAQQRTPTHRQCVVTLRPVYVAGREAMVNVCGVAVARLQEHSWAPTLLNGQKVNVGTVLLVPHRPAACWPVGKVRCRLIPTGWGGGPVVVRDRESRSHGEGVQRACLQGLCRTPSQSRRQLQRSSRYRHQCRFSRSTRI